MQYEPNFDNAEGFSELEITATSVGVIKSTPNPPVFYRQISPRMQYDHHKRLTKEAEETTQEAEKEAERIHKKYHP